MVEMLLAAFILAIGILGLAMLQTYAFHSQAGSTAVATAVQISGQILDQADMAGRNSVLCSQTSIALPAMNPAWFGGANIVTTYNYSGLAVPPNPGPAFFTATTLATITPTLTNGVVTPIQYLGGMANVATTVSWTDGTNQAGAGIARTVTLTRRINYATH